MEYLLNHLQNIGFSKSGAMSMIPIDLQDIKAYSDLMGLEFMPFEITTMLQCSKAYVGQANNKDPLANKPYIDLDAMMNIDMSDKIKASFANF
jgi:hypothetical protein